MSSGSDRNPAANEGIHQLADFAVSLEVEHIPETVLNHASMLLADTLGCALLGAQMPWNQSMVRAMAAAEPTGDVLAWGTPQRFGPSVAALVNGTAIHGFELDDVGAGQHNGSVAFPAAFAVAESGLASRSGEVLLVAFVTGCEVVARIMRTIGRRPHVEMGFHGPGLLGVFAAAAAAGKAMALDEEQMVSALAHAGQQAGGLMATHHGGMGKRMLQGRAAQSGTIAAILAGHGFTNTADTLTATYGGFFSSFSGGSTDFDWSRLTEGLGEEWVTLESLVKLWACRVPIHPTLEAIASLRGEGVRAEDVTRIVIRLDSGSYKAVGGEPVSNSPASAQLNLAYCTAAALIDGELFVDQFTDERLADKQILSLAGRIETLHDTEMDRGGLFQRRSLVEVTLASGEVRHAEGIQKGQKENPMPADDVRKKFERMCAFAGVGTSVELLWNGARAVRNENDIRELVAAFELPR